MKNFTKVLQQLDQKASPIFCDEGVYRIAVDMYFKCPSEFKMFRGVFTWRNVCNTVLESIYETAV